MTRGGLEGNHHRGGGRGGGRDRSRGRWLWLAVLTPLVAGCPHSGAGPGAVVASADSATETAPPDDERAEGVGPSVGVEAVEVEVASKSAGKKHKLPRRPREKQQDDVVVLSDAPGSLPAGAGESIAGIDLSGAQRDASIEPRLKRARSQLAVDPDRAIAEAMAVLEVQSDHIEAALILGQAYYAKGWLSKAEQVLSVASRYPAGARDAQVWMLLGLVHERAGNPLESAREAYLKATKLKPNYAKAWNNLCAVDIKLEEYAHAISACESALAIDSNAVPALTNAGTAYRRQASVVAQDLVRRDELLRKAERSYRAAIALDEKHGPAYLDLGLLLLDTDPFPGMDTLSRLQSAVRYLREFKRLGWSGEEGAEAMVAIDGYLDAAQKQVDILVRAEQAKGKPRRSRGGP